MYLILRLLNIKPGEGVLVGLVLAQAVFVYMANVLMRTVCFTLFLDTYGAETLPFTYIGASLLSTVVTVVYLRSASQFRLSWILIGNTSVLLLSLIGYRIAIGAIGASWLIFTLPIYFGVANALILTGFWNLLGRLFNLQQGKRLFGLLVGSEHIAALIAGFLTPTLIASFGMLDLFTLAAISMGIALVFLIAILRRYGALMLTPEEEQETPTAPGGLLRWDRYMLLIAIAAILYVISVYSLDNLFYADMQTQYTDLNTMGSFMGAFLGLAGLLSLIMQIFVSGRLLKTTGVRAVLLVTPLALIVLTLAYVIASLVSATIGLLFLIIAGANLLHLTLEATDSAAVNVLYQPLPVTIRTRFQTMIDGIVYPAAKGIAGVFLLILFDGAKLSPVQLTFIVLIVLICWLGVVLFLNREYSVRLLRTLFQNEAAAPELRTSTITPHIEAKVRFALAPLIPVLQSTIGTVPIPELSHAQDRVLEALSEVYPSSILRAYASLSLTDDKAQRAVMLEVFEVSIPRQLKRWIIPLFAELSPEDRWRQLQDALTHDRHSTQGLSKRPDPPRIAILPDDT